MIADWRGDSDVELVRKGREENSWCFEENSWQWESFGEKFRCLSVCEEAAVSRHEARRNLHPRRCLCCCGNLNYTSDPNIGQSVPMLSRNGILCMLISYCYVTIYVLETALICIGGSFREGSRSLIPFFLYNL